MLRAILNKSWQQHPIKRQRPIKHQLYGHLPLITKTIKFRRTTHARHCWRSRDELISDVLLWTPTYGRAKAGRLAGIYIQLLCEDTGCSLEDLLEAMNDREKWQERVRDIRASGTTYDDNEYSSFLNIFIWTIDGTLKGTTTPCWPGRNSDEWYFYILQISSTGTSSSSALWRCPWCSRYRRRKYTRWHEFKSWTRLIAFSHSTNTLGKGMNPIILPPVMGK